MRCPGVAFRSCGNSMHQSAAIKTRFPTREPLVSPGLPWWLRRICLQCRRPGFNPWVGKIPWRRERLPTPVFWPGEFHGRRSLAGYSLWGHKESDTTEWLSLSLFMYQKLLLRDCGRDFKTQEKINDIYVDNQANKKKQLTTLEGKKRQGWIRREMSWWYTLDLTRDKGLL